jgi:hypothetical protein
MINSQLDWEEAILAWEDTDRLEAHVQWTRGDIAQGLKPVYGERTLEKFAETVGVEYHQLRNYKAVSQAYQPAVRTAKLSWTHHERIAARPDRLEWLERAAEANPKWSVKKMLEEIAAADSRRAEEEEQEIDQDRAMLDLQRECDRFAKDVACLLTKVRPAPTENQRYWLGRALARADEAHQAIHRHLELDGSGLDEN